MEQPARSFVIPILDFSPHSPYNIRTLLKDLEAIQGEVICIFNSHEVFEELKSHPRIDKFCFNNLNAGVSRSWNLGINMAEGQTVFIMNADIHVLPPAVDVLEKYLFNLDQAVIVGPQGSFIDYRKLQDIRYFTKGTFDKPIACDNISGFFFAIHRERFLEHKLSFDVRYSPCFFEEWDMGLQLKEARLKCYVVPVTEFDHHWGISQSGGDTPINYFGHELLRDQILIDNRERFIRKWHDYLTGKKSFQQLQANDKSSSSKVDVPASGIQRLMRVINTVQQQAYGESITQEQEDITGKAIAHLLNGYPLPEGARILDVGCGRGTAMDLFTKAGHEVTGITIDDGDLEYCRAKGFNVLKMDQSFMSFPDTQFDFIWARHCLEHSIFPFYTLSEFNRVLRNGSYVYMEVPATDTLSQHERNPNHYSVLTDEMWGSLLERTGFQVLEKIDITFQAPIGPEKYWAFISRKTVL